MQTQQDPNYTETDEVRAGSTPHVTRWVLAFGLLGAIVLLTAIWVIGAASSDQHNQTVSAEMRAADANAGGSHTDSIVSDNADQTKAVTQGQSTDPQNTPNKNAGQ